MKRVIAFLCAAAVGVTAGLICSSAFAVTTVTDRTMEPNYLIGTHVFLNCQIAGSGELHRGDVVLFENRLYKDTGEDGIMMKRVIGLPGEEILIEQGRVYVDGTPLQDTWTDIYRRGTDNMEARRVPEDCYFVLGDNRRQSTDSRDVTVGMIREEDILGKVIKQW